MITEISYVTATVIPFSINVWGIGDAVVSEFSVRLGCGREDDQKNEIPGLLAEVRLDFLASDDETE